MQKTCGTCIAFNFDHNTCYETSTDKSPSGYCYLWSDTVTPIGTIPMLDGIAAEALELGRKLEDQFAQSMTMIVPRNIRIEEPRNYITPHPTWLIYDASKVSEYMMCARRFFYRYVLGWESEYRSHDLDFGSAWHIAMEYLLLNGYGKEQILEAHLRFRNYYESYFPIEQQTDLEPKTSAMALLALAAYVENYIAHDHFKVHYTEVSGSINVLNNRIMHFRIDTIAEDEQGVFSLEHKTTKTLERTFQDKWELDTQPNLYSHVLHCLFPGKHIRGVIINGTCLHKQGPRTKKPPAEFLRVPVMRKPEMMNTWINNNEMWLREIEADYDMLSEESDSDDTMLAFKQNPTACTDFWGCRYHDFCISWANPLQYCLDVPTGFVQRYWDPAHPEDHPPAKFEYYEGQIRSIA